MAYPDQVKQIAQSGQKQALECFKVFHQLAFFERMKSESFEMIKGRAETFDKRVQLSEKELGIDVELRLEVYQILQTLHRYFEVVRVLFVQMDQSTLVFDTLDLPRLKLGTISCSGFPDQQSESVLWDVLICQKLDNSSEILPFIGTLRKGGILMVLDEISKQEEKAFQRYRLRPIRYGLINRILDRIWMSGIPILPKTKKVVLRILED